MSENPQVWESSRAEIAEVGWGKRLLDAQDAGGTWGHGLYGPKWTSTTYTLLLLRRLGLAPSNPQAIAGCRRLLDDATWISGGVSLFTGIQLAEKCVNGMVLSLASYFDVPDSRVRSIADMLMDGGLPDGGWNCRDIRGAVHSSFHTTISVLEGLQEWKRRTRSQDADQAIAFGQEFMLRHRMYQSHRTGEVINSEWLTFHFPPRWHYDVLRGLEHLQDADAAPDERAADAIELVVSKRLERRSVGQGKPVLGKGAFRPRTRQSARSMEHPQSPTRSQLVAQRNPLNSGGSSHVADTPPALPHGASTATDAPATLAPTSTRPKTQ